MNANRLLAKLINILHDHLTSPLLFNVSQGGLRWRQHCKLPQIAILSGIDPSLSILMSGKIDLVLFQILQHLLSSLLFQACLAVYLRILDVL